jgi:hypothetical protein
LAAPGYQPAFSAGGYDSGALVVSQPRPIRWPLAKEVRVLHRHNQWARATGKILQSQIVPGPKLPNPTLLTVELHPEGSPPLQAEVRLSLGDRSNWDLSFPAVGRVTGFIFDPASGEARLDLADPRNSIAAHRAASEAWESRLPDQPVRAGSGPPWLVPAKCPRCGKPVIQQMAAREDQPHCQHCTGPLPAYPYLGG